MGNVGLGKGLQIRVEKNARTLTPQGLHSDLTIVRAKNSVCAWVCVGGGGGYLVEISARSLGA